MAEWELICHHTYSGIPGVVVDRSPTGSSYGRAINLADGDFLPDGASPGSGAVRFDNAADGAVHVSAEASAWRSLPGLKGEATVRRLPGGVNFILDSNSFRFFIRSDGLSGWFNSYPLQYAAITSTLDPLGSQPYTVPVNSWVTLGFMHDGFRTLELSADGEVVARLTRAYEPINPIDSAGIRIGNTLSGGGSLLGEREEVKIWRLNPRRMYDEFHARPMNAEAANCWKIFEESLQAALRRHPDCVERLAIELRNAVRGGLQTILANGPAVTERLRSSAEIYEKLWRTGNIGTSDMAECLAGLIQWLRAAGMDAEQNPAFNALVNSECFGIIVSEINPLECDPQFIHMMESTGRRLSTGDAGSAL
jgi:hypothetical protein